MAVVLALLGVFAVGSTCPGLARWFGFGSIQLQPSEFAVIGSDHRRRRLLRSSEPKRAWPGRTSSSLILSGIPIGLVLIQPDLGTAIIMMIVLLVMLAVAGLPIRILVMLSWGWCWWR